MSPDLSTIIGEVLAALIAPIALVLTGVGMFGLPASWKKAKQDLK